MLLDSSAAFEAVNILAMQLSVSVFEAAFSILAVSNESMINAIKDMTVSEGVDPNETTIVAGGGAAGLGILSIAADLNCKTVLIPRAASVLSASGMQYSDIQYERSIMLPMRSNSFDCGSVNDLLDRLDLELKEFTARLASKGFANSVVSYRVDTKYATQVWDMPIILPFKRFNTNDSVRDLIELFHTSHQRVFNVDDRASPVEFTNWTARLVVTIPKTNPQIQQSRFKPTLSQRLAYFNPDDETITQVFRGEKFSIGEKIEGPAIIEEPTTTIVVPPNASLSLNESLNYVVQFNADEQSILKEL